MMEIAYLTGGLVALGILFMILALVADLWTNGGHWDAASRLLFIGLVIAALAFGVAGLWFTSLGVVWLFM